MKTKKQLFDILENRRILNLTNLYPSLMDLSEEGWNDQPLHATMQPIKSVGTPVTSRNQTGTANKKFHTTGDKETPIIGKKIVADRKMAGKPKGFKVSDIDGDEDEDQPEVGAKKAKPETSRKTAGKDTKFRQDNDKAYEKITDVAKNIMAGKNMSTKDSKGASETDRKFKANRKFQSEENQVEFSEIKKQIEVDAGNWGIFSKAEIAKMVKKAHAEYITKYGESIPEGHDATQKDAASSIGYQTGMRDVFIIKWAKEKNIDLLKVVDIIANKKMTGIDIMTAIAGNDNNKYQKKLIKLALNESKRSLSTIAYEIKADWKKVNYAAKPYLDAMISLNSIDDNYFMDSGRSVVAYFLGNATSWRGDKARSIKKELNAMLKS